MRFNCYLAPETCAPAPPAHPSPREWRKPRCRAAVTVRSERGGSLRYHRQSAPARRLLEGDKERVKRLGRDAHAGIAHRKRDGLRRGDQRRNGNAAYRDHDFATLSELHGIVTGPHPDRLRITQHGSDGRFQIFHFPKTSPVGCKDATMQVQAARSLTVTALCYAQDAMVRLRIRKVARAIHPSEDAMDALTLAVCPHDTLRNPEGWWRLAKYLAQHMGVKIRFRPALDFADFHSRWATADLIYAGAGDALTLLDEQGFTPVARPTDTYDEALLVACPKDPMPPLEALGGADVATVADVLPTRLALRMLEARGIVPRTLTHRDSWLSVVRAVWGGETPYGILYRDAYDELSPAGKAMVQVITTTSERCAFHVFCGSSRLGADAGALADVLVAMASDGAGRDILDSLHMVSWRTVAPDELTLMRGVLA